MWRNYFATIFAIDDDTLTMKESYEKDRCSYYYPMGKNIDNMIMEIKDCAIKDLDHQSLEFCCVNENKLDDLKKVFPHNKYFCKLEWADYLYLNENFQTFSGGKYANKRHHVKNFEKNHPDVIFKKCNSCDKNSLIKFVDEFSETKVINTTLAYNELEETKDLIRNLFKFNFDAFVLMDKGEIIALSICEVLNNCVYDHIEKALREYNSIYPFFVQKIANYYKDIKYFNREDDGGDEGLRFSKQDYHPIEMVDNYMFYIMNNLDLLNKIPEIKVTDNISLNELLEIDSESYYNLVTNENLNKYWGYDYKSDLNGEVANAAYFYKVVKNDFEKKESLSFIVKVNNKLAGEIVLFNLDNENSATIGYRLLEEYQHQGIMSSSVEALIKFLKDTLKMHSLKTYIMKNNESSLKIMEKLNFNYINEDEKYKYFELVLN